MDHAFAPAYGLWSLVIINPLVFMYVHLVRREERDARAQLGEAYTSLRGEHACVLSRDWC